MFMKAFLVALIAGICKIDNRVFGMTMIQRPLIVGTLVGFIYGNPVEGMIIGAQFELLSMGLVGIGAHSGMPEITLGSALCTGFVLGGAGPGPADFHLRHNHRISDLDSVKSPAQRAGQVGGGERRCQNHGDLPVDGSV